MPLNPVPWPGEQMPTENALHNILHSEGLAPQRWSNGPNTVYAAHVHATRKVLYVVQGSITFGLPEQGERVTLRPGDRLDLPAGMRHDAVVGPEGVVCLEAHAS